MIKPPSILSMDLLGYVLNAKEALKLEIPGANQSLLLVFHEFSSV